MIFLVDTNVYVNSNNRLYFFISALSILRAITYQNTLLVSLKPSLQQRQTIRKQSHQFSYV